MEFVQNILLEITLKLWNIQMELKQKMVYGLLELKFIWNVMNHSKQVQRQVMLFVRRKELGDKQGN